MLVVTIVKYTEHGNLIMTLKATRNPVLDYMTQASMLAKDYILNGWHLVYARIE